MLARVRTATRPDDTRLQSRPVASANDLGENRDVSCLQVSSGIRYAVDLQCATSTWRGNMQRAASIVCAVLVLSGCTSTGTLGLVTKSGSDPGAVLREGRPYRDLGPARGSSCRYFLLAVVPWGDGTFSSAVNEALAKSGGDALLNVTVTNSLYGFIPIYNVLTYQC